MTLCVCELRSLASQSNHLIPLYSVQVMGIDNAMRSFVIYKIVDCFVDNRVY